MRARMLITWVVVLGIFASGDQPLAAQNNAAPPALPSDAQAPTSPPMPSRQTQRAPSPLERVVTVTMTNVRLADVLDEIDRQANLGLAYTRRVVPFDKRVSIKADHMPAGDALASVLRGTSVRAVVMPSGTVVLRSEKQTTSSTRVGTGWVWGQVVDSTTARVLAGVEMSIVDSSIRASTSTNDSGYFVLPNIPVGVHALLARHYGYVADKKDVLVADSQQVRVDFALHMSMSHLQDVVVTATGGRRRIELGNDITVLNADSIVSTQPVANVTALLEGRVPGLTVQHTSGAPGDPSRLRLRGAGSLTESNDPIVILDGVRIYAAQSDARSANLASPLNATSITALTGAAGGFGSATPSPLDQIDVNSVETIEVLKGPSAATLYGADAANGVIVITTKKGKAGPPQWRVSAERGLSYMPGEYPERYLRWGHNIGDNAPRWCPVTDLTCTGDSLSRFQPLNDSKLTPLGQGNRTAVTLGVSGGSDALSYAITGSASDDIGLLTLPSFAAQQFEATQGSAPPDWMRRPHDYKQFSGTSRMTVRLGPKADIALTTMFSHDDQQRSSLENQLGALSYTYINPTTNTYQAAGIGFFANTPQLLSGFYQRTTDVANTFRNALSLNWRPRQWLIGSADAGFDVVSREDEVLLPRGYSPTADSVGLLNQANGSSFVTTMNVRGTATAPLPWGFSFQTSLGANYTGSRTNDALFTGTDIPVAAVAPTQAVHHLSSESRSDAATFGVYVEPSLSRKRLWISTGYRFDGGNTFGTHQKLAGFPKVSVSYLLSDEPFFPFKNIINTLRLRAAYGHAGVQPGAGDQLRLYNAIRTAPLDSASVNVVTLQTLGNTELKPERSTEFEGGFDADLWNDWLSVGVSGYRKTREDALMLFPLPPSVYGEGASILRNIGVIRNSGVEASVNAQLVRSDVVTWSVQASVSSNKNVVVALAPGVEGLNNTAPGVGSLFRLQAGYPLFGIWARPILGYADVNGNGVLELGDVQVGDSAAYMGSSEPDYEATFSTGVSLFHGTVRVDAGFLYQHGLTQLNEADVGRSSASRALNDPSAPLGEVAGMVAMSGDLWAGLLSQGVTPYGVIQTVSMLRFNSLSVAYNAPASMARRMGASAMTLALQGTNLGLFTNYRGKDPNVNGYPGGNNVLDSGQLPEPRSWQLRVSLQY